MYCTILSVHQIMVVDCMTLYQSYILVSVDVYCVVDLYRLFCLSCCLTEVVD